MPINENFDETRRPFSTAFRNGGRPRAAKRSDRCAITAHGSPPAPHSDRFARTRDPVHILKQHPDLTDGDAIDSGQIVRIYEECIDNLIADEERSISRGSLPRRVRPCLSGT